MNYGGEQVDSPPLNISREFFRDTYTPDETLKASDNDDENIPMD